MTSQVRKSWQAVKRKAVFMSNWNSVNITEVWLCFANSDNICSVLKFLNLKSFSCHIFMSFTMSVFFASTRNHFIIPWPLLHKICLSYLTRNLSPFCCFQRFDKLVCFYNETLPCFWNDRCTVSAYVDHSCKIMDRDIWQDVLQQDEENLMTVIFHLNEQIFFMVAITSCHTEATWGLISFLWIWSYSLTGANVSCLQQHYNKLKWEFSSSSTADVQ